MTQGIASPRVATATASVDLKWSLTLRVVAVVALCFFAASAIAIIGTFREVRGANAEVADSVGKLLELQLARIDWGLDVERHFPDWDLVLDHFKASGRCVKYVSKLGQVTRSMCEGVDPTRSAPPAWFVALCLAMPISNVGVERPVTHRGRPRGAVQVTTQPDAAVASVWHELAGLLRLSALTAGAVCLLVYVVIGRALGPAREVLAGLDRLSSGDLSCRLPRFHLVELQRISDVFNGLAASLEATTAERAALARKLIDAQEQERRRLARELHDELAQNLSAMSAVAASIRKTAEKECPALLQEAHSLGQTAMAIMKALRVTLQNLRPQEIDDFGLAASLSRLVADFERRVGTPVRLDVDGDVDGLPPTARVHVYRIVQEGLTNIAKHADAGAARISLRVQANGAGAAGRRSDWLVLAIENDGKRCGRAVEAPAGMGFGLIGMRERVMALGGRLDIRPDVEKGFGLLAVIPYSPALEAT